MSYRYFGILAGKLKAVLALSLVSFVHGSHAAVWLGASNQSGGRAVDWVQAGIEQSWGERQPQIYVEVGRDGHQIMLRTWPITLHHRMRVELRHKGAYWQATIGGHRSHYVHIPGRANVFSLLEIYSNSTPTPAIAYLDGRHIRGH